MLKFISKALSFSLLGAVLAIIVFLLYVTFQSNKHPEKVPSFFGYSPLTVLTNSMHPYIKAGDMVFIKKVEPLEVKVNDVITFKETPTKKLITHRVVKIVNKHGKRGFVTKGDNNNVKDSRIVSENQLVGDLAFKIPKAGLIAKFVSGPIGFILLILIPFAGYICLEVYDRLSKGLKSDHAEAEVKG
ncbi:signal peptidase I [Fictibacillus gelatini]|uniref:signal peptidase I n=1 Tax=Fictibacillus gelatini TaxID=225985 RepID=UPI0003F80340|nr:signal peptidase I [Fictibacillus gelatini]